MEKTKIFIIEDELIHLEAAKIAVWECGFQTVGSSDSQQEAIRQIVQYKPDVVLVDINLNGKKLGIELAKQIISEFHIPVIFTTCFNDYQTIKKAIETDPVSYIVKPLDTSNLKAAVMLALKKKGEKSSDKNAVTLVLHRIIKKRIFNTNFSKDDKEFMQMLTGVVLKNVTNPELDIIFLAGNLAISRTGLYRTINKITKMSPGKLIRTIRLEQAALFFEEGECSVSQCAYNTGFENLSYFTKCFREYFEILPSEYRNRG